MTYHGKVKPGGASDVRELKDMVITKFAVSDMANNVYLLRCRHTDEQVLVDAADEPTRILSTIGSDGLSAVITTHGHWDHHRALHQVVEATNAETVAGAEDADDLPVKVDRRVGDGDTVTVGSSSLEVIHLVGHTPGSIALLYDDPAGTPHLFTGDSLFPAASARRGQRRTSPPSSTTSSRRCSGGCPTRPGSTPATATTRPSAPSGHTSRSGAPAAGSAGSAQMERWSRQARPPGPPRSSRWPTCPPSSRCTGRRPGRRRPAARRRRA
jgi:hypothetical protein